MFHENPLLTFVIVLIMLFSVVVYYKCKCHHSMKSSFDGLGGQMIFAQRESKPSYDDSGLL